MLKIAPRHLCTSAGAVALALIVASPAYAQSDAVTASLTGRVMDQTKAVLPGATVTATSIERGTVRTVETNAAGVYRVALLEPGRYDINVEFKNFTPHVLRNLSLTVGEISVLDVTLIVGSIATTSEVSAAPPATEPRRTQQANTIGALQIEALPNINRQFSAYVLTLPGVTNADAPRAQNPGFSWPTGGFSIGGNNGRNNLITVDGGEHEYGTGTIRTPLNVETIQEFQVNRAGFAAEFGFTAGTAINVVTKSGTNTARGSAYTWFTSSRLAARNFFDHDPVRAYSQTITPGATLGGPVRRDHLFAFLAVEGLVAEQARFHPFLDSVEVYGPTSNSFASISLREQDRYLNKLSASPDANIRRIGANLRQALTTTTYAATVQMLRDASTTTVARDHRQYYTARLDYQSAGRDRVMLKVTSFRPRTDSSFIAATPTTAESAAAEVRAPDVAVLASWSRTVGRALLFQTRAQMAMNNSAITPKSQGPTIDIAGLGTFGRSATAPFLIDQKRYQFETTASVFVGSHTLKTGVAYRPIDYNVRAELWFNGLWKFSSGIFPVLLALPSADQGALVGYNLTTIDTATGLPYPATGPAGAALSGLQSFNLGYPLVLLQGSNNPSWSARAHYVSAFAQDSWQPVQRLTLDYGLRFDYDGEPSPVPRHWYVAPRAGLAWDVRGNQRTVVRAASGVFYAPVYLQVAYNAALLSDSGAYINQLLLTPLSRVPPAALWQTYAASGKLPGQSLTTADLQALGVSVGAHAPGRVAFDIDPAYKNPYTFQASVGVTQQIGGALTLDLAYLAYRGHRLGLSQEANYVETGVVDPLLGPQYAAIDPTVTQRNVARSIGRSSYNALTASLTKRLSANHQYQINYTLSHALDDVTDLDSTFSAFMPTRLDREWADSTFDIRHSISASAVFRIPAASGTGRLRRLAGGLTMSPVAVMRSALPFTLRIGRDINGDSHDLYDRPYLAERNSGRGARFITLDGRVSKATTLNGGHLRVEVAAEVSNILNRTNFISVNDVVGTDPQYLRAPFSRTGTAATPPTSPLGFNVAGPGRQLQVGVKLIF